MIDLDTDEKIFLLQRRAYSLKFASEVGLLLKF